MLQPKKSKHRKIHKGRVRGVATKGTKFLLENMVFNL